MAGVLKINLYSARGCENFIVGLCFNQRRDGFGIFCGIKRHNLFRLAETLHPSHLRSGIRFLNMGAVHKQYFDQIAGRLGHVNRAAKTVLHHTGKQSRMIDMRVGDQKEIDFCRIVRGYVPVAFFIFRSALMHAAINGESDLVRFYNEARAGNFSCRSEKFNFHEKSFSVVQNF